MTLNSARSHELDPATSRLFPRARAEPTNDVSALVAPARAQEVVKETLGPSLPEESGSKPEPIRSPGRLHQVPPDTFSFEPRGDRSCWVLPCLQLGEKPRKTLRKQRAPFRWSGGGCAQGARPTSAEGRQRRATHAELIGWSPSRFSGFSNSKLRRLRALGVQSVPSLFFCSGGESEEALGRFKLKYGSTSACFYITASSAFFFLFFYVDASCSENMEFLKGPRSRRAHVAVPAAAAADGCWVPSGFHLPALSLEEEMWPLSGLEPAQTSD